MKKKMLTVLLAAAMTVSLAGCGSKDADKKMCIRDSWDIPLCSYFCRKLRQGRNRS